MWTCPAVSHRFVSFDGTTEVQEQDFSYSPPTWNDPNQPGANDWTSRQTTVVTSDVVRSTQNSTVYTYSPQYADDQPETAAYLQQIPVEQSVKYYDGTNTSVTPLRTVNKLWRSHRAIAKEQIVFGKRSDL